MSVGLVKAVLVVMALAALASCGRRNEAPMTRQVLLG